MRWEACICCIWHGRCIGELPTAGSEKPLMIGFTIFFTIIGAGLGRLGAVQQLEDGKRPDSGGPEPEEGLRITEDGSDENKRGIIWK